MSDHISEHREESRKYDVYRSIFEELRGVWKCGQTMSRVFDIFYQSKRKQRRKWNIKIVKNLCLLVSDIQTLFLVSVLLSNTIYRKTT